MITSPGEIKGMKRLYHLVQILGIMLLVAGGLILFLRWRWTHGLTIQLNPVLTWQTTQGAETLAFTPDERFVATNTHVDSAHITFTALTPQTDEVEFAALGDRISSMTIDSTGTWLAARCTNATICIWTIADAKLLGTIDMPPNESIMTSLQFMKHHAQLHIVWGSQVERWSFPDIIMLRRYTLTEYHAPKRGSMVISSQGTYIAMGNEDGQVTLWDGATGELLITLTEHTDEVAGLAFSPNEQLLATASFDGTIRIWHLPDGQLLHTMDVIGNSDLAFSPDGTILASGDGQETGSHGLRGNSYVFLWDTTTGARIGRTEIVHPDNDGFIRAIAFSATGQMVASVDSDGRVLVWTLVTAP